MYAKIIHKHSVKISKIRTEIWATRTSSTQRDSWKYRTCWIISPYHKSVTHFFFLLTFINDIACTIERRQSFISQRPERGSVHFLIYGDAEEIIGDYFHSGHIFGDKSRNISLRALQLVKTITIVIIICGGGSRGLSHFSTHFGAPRLFKWEMS